VALVAVAVGCNAILGIEDPVPRAKHASGGSAGSGASGATGATTPGGASGVSGASGSGAEAGGGEGPTDLGGSAGRGGSSAGHGGTQGGTAGGTRGGSGPGGSSGTGGAIGGGGDSGEGGTSGSAGNTGGGGGTGAKGGNGGTGGAGTGGQGGSTAGTGGSAGTGVTVVGASCSGESGMECRGESCCTAYAVTPAQTFKLHDANAPTVVDASVSVFTLDKYEVTTSRFQRFVDHYDEWHQVGQNPKAGDGKNPHITNSGWSSSFPLPASAAELMTALATENPGGNYCPTWLTLPQSGTAPGMPMNCVNWYEAFAFCIWDGQRLPTESEWVAASLGGDENRLYPWGPAVPAADLAVYNCVTCTSIPLAGSKPNGVARWGHLDMAGSLWEWVLDTYGAHTDPMNDTANVAASGNHLFRGGSWFDQDIHLARDFRPQHPATDRYLHTGLRCAHTP
jgi:formylglycine-generating enzyme required for sulfatase activity